ncbi:TPA: hypothetical protein I7774_22790 [Vibrio vulnificus]|nr:hypothetical protein [Vibrio vulnificus]
MVSNAQTNLPHTTLNTQNHRKPKMPRVGNPLELFVIRAYAYIQTGQKQITHNSKNHNSTKHFL